jgi:hypothetical protein
VVVVSVVRPDVLTGPEDADGREALHVVPADAERCLLHIA